ncbi:Uncharacterised protein [BD1-7 clade bacterium]|uniref:DUF4426 domain-containing protein n=1 Tax=BD1-7 clade bacterium TaxID=2029982 RepID=A0A5S9QN61_9GAMM|nr:Uncharacterised protein [BD1-7 clade bacterium]CAA0120534.1 Uncharacterised protein [BD1-7 clade bacterium]
MKPTSCIIIMILLFDATLLLANTPSDAHLLPIEIHYADRSRASSIALESDKAFELNKADTDKLQQITASKLINPLDPYKSNKSYRVVFDQFQLNAPLHPTSIRTDNYVKNSGKARVSIFLVTNNTEKQIAQQSLIIGRDTSPPRRFSAVMFWHDINTSLQRLSRELTTQPAK